MENQKYWISYKNLELEVIDLSYNIAFEDKNLTVYSSKIAEIILKCATYIESVSKDLYIENSKTKKERDKIKFDREAIDYLDKNWDLELKKVFIVSPHINFSFKEISPFEINAGKKLYKWNDSYQNLKHDIMICMSEYANIDYLIQIMSALYLLNLYYLNLEFKIYNDSELNNFDKTLGSKLFAIKTCENRHNFTGELPIDKEATYIINLSDEFIKRYKSEYEKSNANFIDLCFKDKKFIEYSQTNSIDANKLKTDSLTYLTDIIGGLATTKYHNVAMQSSNIFNVMKHRTLNAILNKTPKN